MPRTKRAPKQLTITLTITGNLADAHDAARRVLDSGIFQDELHLYSGGPGHAFEITNAEVK